MDNYFEKHYLILNQLYHGSRTSLQCTFDNVLAGHRGVQYTLLRISLYFWWASMIDNITTAVGICKICKTVKAGSKPHYYTGPLAKHTAHPFHTLNLDILGPLPRTNNGKEYIVLFICTLTRYAVLFATKDHMASTVSTCLLRVITTHGVPRTI